MSTTDLRDRIAKAAISAYCYTTTDHVVIEIPGDTSTARREQWVSRADADAVANAVVTEIQKTHRICKPAEITVAALGDLLIHAVDSSSATGSIRKCEVAGAFGVGLRGLGLMIVDIDQGDAS